MDCCKVFRVKYLEFFLEYCTNVLDTCLKTIKGQKGPVHSAWDVLKSNFSSSLLGTFYRALLAIQIPFWLLVNISPFQLRSFFGKHWWETIWSFGIRSYYLSAGKRHSHKVMSWKEGKKGLWEKYAFRELYGHIWATRCHLGSES